MCHAAFNASNGDSGALPVTLGINIDASFLLRALRRVTREICAHVSSGSLFLKYAQMYDVVCTGVCSALRR